MLATAELRKWWIETVREAHAMRTALPRVRDIRDRANYLGMHVDDRLVYSRLEKLVKLGYLTKRTRKGYCNTYKPTEKADKRFPPTGDER